MAIVNSMDLWPLRPGVIRRSGCWCLRQDCELNQTPAAMAQGRSNAVGARVAAPNHDDVLTLRRDEFTIMMIAIKQTLRVGSQKIHCEINSIECAIRNR